jgi:hypothetical protein
MIPINIAGKTDEKRLLRKYWYKWRDDNTKLSELAERMYTALHCFRIYHGVLRWLWFK